MVMSKLTKECLVCIKKSFTRFLSILIIVLLGVGFYAGIKATSPDMEKTVDNYYKKTNFYDLSITSNYGISQENINTLKEQGYNIEGSYSLDAIVKKKDEYAVKVLSYDKNSKINKLVLKKGKLPTKNNECVIEKNASTENMKIGDIITVQDETLKEQELKITGIIESPLYISKERDNTKLLSGKINFYLYTPKENFTSDIYTMAYIDQKTTTDVFSKSYKDQIKQEKKKIKKLVSNLEVSKYEQIKKEATTKLEQAKKEYQQNEQSSEQLLNSPYVTEEQKQSLKDTLAEAKKQIEEQEDKINSLEVEWYVLDINSNTGFYQYKQDTERITNVAKVFPVVFFIVAILICLTTMTRMVEEERVQIGTLKSLGYKDNEIMIKYLLYAFLATILGSLIGVCIGFAIIPPIIFKMYSMMYTIGNFSSNFYIGLTAQGTIIALICTIGATIYTAITTLKESPSELLLPKSPKPGKRVILEKIPFIWKRLSFSKKVTVRNVFRYKKRFLMTIIGISGCSGLIIAGFGLKDCITQMIPNQYEKVFNYQVSVTLKEDSTLENKNKDYKEIKNLKEVKDALKIQEEVVDIKDPDTNQSPILIVPFGDITPFIQLQDRKTNQKYSLKEDIIITEKLAKLLDIKTNDQITFEGNANYKAKVGNITENYFFHYIYMNKNQYKGTSYNTILLKTDKMNEKEEKEFSKKINKLESVSTLSFTSATKSTFDSTMKNFGYVSLVLIVSAGLLAFVVLYNLSSVNISERKRELASLKVLGFYDKEVYRYVSRETMILTGIGMILGLLVGKILTNFVIKTCELDMIMFDPHIKFMSYFVSLLITLVFTILVNISVYFSLKKIDMIESLKSVE